MSANLNGNLIRNPSHRPDELLSDVFGILLLLRSAVLSLQADGAESTCAETLKGCICEIQKRYDLAERDYNAGITLMKPSTDGLIRLLEYVECEIRDRLHDRKTARELRVCIHILTGSAQFATAAGTAQRGRSSAGKERIIN